MPTTDPVRVPETLPDGIYRAADDNGRMWELLIVGDSAHRRHVIVDHQTGQRRGTAIHQPPYDSGFWTRSGSQTGPIAQALTRIVADPDGTRLRRHSICQHDGCGRRIWGQTAVKDGLGSAHARQARTGG